MKNEKPFKPHIVNAFYNWALEDNKTPYIQVNKKSDNVIPIHLENNDYIILRLHSDSVYNLVFSSDYINFLAYFNGEPFQLSIPYQNIRSIFCKENNYGLNFDSEENIYEQKSFSMDANDEILTVSPKLKIIKGGKE